MVFCSSRLPVPNKACGFCGQNQNRLNRDGTFLYFFFYPGRTRIMFMCAHGRYVASTVTKRAAMPVPHRVSANFSAGVSRSSEAQPERQAQNISPGNRVHRLVSNTDITPLNLSSWLERGCFPVSCDVNILTFGLWYTSQSTLTFILEFELFQAKLHFLQKRQENAIIW